MDMEQLVSLCRRRGFIFGSSEIYGGINGFWEYGPLGVELKRNIKDVWWHDMVRNPPPGPDAQEISMVGVDCSIIMNPKVWEASGHVGGFADPMVDCKACRSRFRADQLYVVLIGFFAPEKKWTALTSIGVAAGSTEEAKQSVGSRSKSLQKKAGQQQLEMMAGTYSKIIVLAQEASPSPLKFESGVEFPVNWREQLTCPQCEKAGTLTDPRQFNLMFKTYVGALEDASCIAYLRHETAQGFFVNFHNVLDSTRLKLPFGIAQAGKAFRNEINPRNYTFRSREFEQMEIELFCHPDESSKWYDHWRDVRIRWYSQLGIKSQKLRPREQSAGERAPYSPATTPTEYLSPSSHHPPHPDT